MSGYDRRYEHGLSPSGPPLGGGTSSRLTADYGSQQQSSHLRPGDNNSSMASVAAWRDQQASLHVSGSLEDDDRLDDNASSEGLGAKRSHDSHGDSRDEPRRKRMITTPHQVNVLSEELRRNPFPSAERRDELAKELGMEPRRVQVWFQNRRQAERLARGRPPYNMMYGNPWYPPPYGYPGYPAMMPPPGAFPPMGTTGDPSLDILIPYGPRRPSLMPPSLQGDSLMRGGLPPSHALSGSLASRQSANDIAAASYHTGSEFGDVSEYGRRESSGSQMRSEDFGRPTTLAQDLAAMESQRPPVFDGHAERRSRNTLGRSISHMPLSSSSSHLQPFQSLSPDFSLPLPSSLNGPSGLPSLNASLEDPFQLPLPKLSSSSRSRGAPTSEDSPFGSPFDPSRTLAPPRSLADRAATGIGRLPSLSQALEMHPELSPDPKSFRYPPDYEQSLLGGGSTNGSIPSNGAGRNGAGSLRRRNSISRLNETSTQSRPSMSTSTGLHSDVLPPLAPFSMGSGSSSSSSAFRAPSDPRRPSGRPSGEFAHPLMSANPRSLRRMSSDAAMQTSARRQSLRESDMGRDAFPPPARYGL